MATKISYNRGTTANYTVNYTNSSGVAGATILFSVKQDVDANTTDTTALFKTNAAMTANQAIVEILPTSIAPSFDEGNYVYDIKVIDTSGDIFLLVEGVFALNASATNRTS